jgi:hypothetical protein
MATSPPTSAVKDNYSNVAYVTSLHAVCNHVEKNKALLRRVKRNFLAFF